MGCNAKYHTALRHKDRPLFKLCWATGCASGKGQYDRLAYSFANFSVNNTSSSTKLEIILCAGAVIAACSSSGSTALAKFTSAEAAVGCLNKK